MAQAGKRYSLLIYEHTLKRWYPATFLLSVALFAFWWFLPIIMPNKGANWVDDLAFYSSIGALVLSIFFMGIRKMAYVRPYPDHLRLATPFLRLKISYKRFHKTTLQKCRRFSRHRRFPHGCADKWPLS
jgi:hypothetical protein